MSSVDLPIPDELFDVLEPLVKRAERPICACSFAVEGAVPSGIARSFLELQYRQRNVIRADLREFWNDLPPSGQRRLNTEECGHITRFLGQGPLYAFIHRRLASVDPLTLFIPLIIELGMMLTIQALLSRPERVSWTFQATCHIFEYHVESGRDSPVGRGLMSLGELPQRLSKYLQSLRSEEGICFAQFEVNRLTQLRILLELGLVAAEGGPWTYTDLYRSSPEARRAVVRRLYTVIAEGLEAPPDRRIGDLRELLGDTDCVPMARSLLDGRQEWLAWLRGRIRACKSDDAKHAYQTTVRELLSGMDLEPKGFRSVAQEAAVSPTEYFNHLYDHLIRT